VKDSMKNVNWGGLDWVGVGVGIGIGIGIEVGIGIEYIGGMGVG